MVTAFERYIGGSLAFRIADISVATTVSDVWFGTDLPRRGAAWRGRRHHRRDRGRHPQRFNGTDVVNGGAGDDILSADYGYDVLIGGPGNDQLIGAGVAGITKYRPLFGPGRRLFHQQERGRKLDRLAT